MKKDVMNEVLKIKEYVTNIRRDIHENPELGHDEIRTTALIKKELESYGVEIVPLDIKTGVVGILKGTKDPNSKKVTALRADIDALPILEETGVAWESKNPGVMHACGHDAHTAMLLGAAKILSEMKEEFSGTVKFIFQPAEEVLDGAESIIKAGVLENPKPDNIITLHGGGEIKVGTVGVYPGSFMASADMFTVKIRGIGAHGGYPHRGTDSILAASQAVVALQSIVSREIDAVEKTVISVCTINGGSAFNIIPREVVFSGSVRCHDKEVRESIEGRINRIVGGVAEAYGCTHELEYTYGIPQVYNDEAITSDIKNAAIEVLGEENVIDLDRPLMGSEDFAFYLEEVPGAIFRVGFTDDEEIKLHHPKFDFPDEALTNGIAVFINYVLNINK